MTLMAFIYSLRASRLGPEIIDERVARIVQGLKQREFLKGTIFEKRAVESGVDPYSLLLGILVGFAAAVILGALTIEMWLPSMIARITRKSITEATRAVREVLLASSP